MIINTSKKMFLEDLKESLKGSRTMFYKIDSKHFQIDNFSYEVDLSRVGHVFYTRFRPMYDYHLVEDNAELAKKIWDEDPAILNEIWKHYLENEIAPMFKKHSWNADFTYCGRCEKTIEHIASNGITKCVSNSGPKHNKIFKSNLKPKHDYSDSGFTI